MHQSNERQEDQVYSNYYYPRLVNCIIPNFNDRATALRLSSAEVCVERVGKGRRVPTDMLKLMCK